MIRSIRELKKQMHDRLREEQIERDEEGRAVVKMTVLRDEDFLSDFSAGSIPVISSQVAEFIEERTPLRFYLTLNRFWNGRIQIQSLPRKKIRLSLIRRKLRRHTTQKHSI